MALSKTDKEWIESIISKIISAEIGPIRDEEKMLMQTVYGETRKDGLRKDVACHTEDLQKIKVKMGWIAGLVTSVLLIVKEIGSYFFTSSK
jgi:hypothetical protein